MKDRKCTFEYSIEENGNWNKKSGTGICRSEPMMKKGKEGDYLVCLVEADDGQMHEVFSNKIKFAK